MNLVDTQTGLVVGEVQAFLKARLDEIAGVGDDQERHDLALIDNNFRFTPTGLEVVGNPTFQQCERKVYEIYGLGKMAPIWLGDLLNYMENVYGEGYAQVLDATGLSYQTVANTKSVMGRVPKPVRQEGLYLTHYAQIANMSHSDQERLLKKAKDEELNTSEFTRVVRREKRQAVLGKLPEKVKMEVNIVFSVPDDLKDKFRFSVEGWRNRLEEWDIECDYLDISEIK